MNLRRLLVPVALCTSLSGGVFFDSHARAQDAGQLGGAIAGRVSLFDAAGEELPHPSQSSLTRSQATAQELRTARAIYRANQRVARMEHNLWIGHEPLRPRWNAIPMMTSRYPTPTIYVPVYVYNR